MDIIERFRLMTRDPITREDIQDIEAMRIERVDAVAREGRDIY